MAVEKLFDLTPDIRGHTLKSLTRQEALFELRVSVDPSYLMVNLSEKGWHLENQGSHYVLTPNFGSHS